MYCVINVHYVFININTSQPFWGNRYYLTLWGAKTFKTVDNRAYRSKTNVKFHKYFLYVHFLPECTSQRLVQLAWWKSASLSAHSFHICLINDINCNKFIFLSLEYFISQSKLAKLNPFYVFSIYYKYTHILYRAVVPSSGHFHFLHCISFCFLK